MKNKKPTPSPTPAPSAARFDWKKAAQSPAAFAAAVGLLSVVMVALLMDRSLSQWNLPLMYEWDSLNVMTIAKAGIERAWASGSDRLGAPGTLDLAYYPMPEYGQLLLIKIISLFGLDAAASINGYFFLTFFLATAIGAYTLVRLGLHYSLAAVGGLVFSLLPAHFWRGSQHMFVNGYFLVPALCYVLVQRRTFRHDGENAAASQAHFRMACILSVLSPLFNVYYSFFYCFLLGSLAVFEACGQGGREPLARTAKLFACVALGGFLGMTRSLPLYISHQLGFVRPPQDSEIYGLKITQLILPAFGTISEYMSAAYTKYRTTAPLVTENRWNDLGLLAAIAFIVALVAGFAVHLRDTPQADTQDNALLRRAGMCNVVCILYGTIGGLSAFFSYVVSPLIRSTNRIEVFIAFFSLFISLLLLQNVLTSRLAERWRHPAVAMALAAIPAAILFWDMGQKAEVRPDFARSDAIYLRDRAFFQKLEASLPAGARIFQIPELPYPEAGIGEPEYDNFRPFLHTNTLVWSFGAVRGTEAEQDNRRAEALLLGGQHAPFRDYLTRHNFKGVLLSRKIAARLRSNHEEVARAALGPPQMTDTVGEFVFYPVN